MTGEIADGASFVWPSRQKWRRSARLEIKLVRFDIRPTVFAYRSLMNGYDALSPAETWSMAIRLLFESSSAPYMYHVLHLQTIQVFLFTSRSMATRAIIYRSHSSWSSMTITNYPRITSNSPCPQIQKVLQRQLHSKGVP